VKARSSRWLAAFSGGEDHPHPHRALASETSGPVFATCRPHSSTIQGGTLSDNSLRWCTAQATTVTRSPVDASAAAPRPVNARRSPREFQNDVIFAEPSESWHRYR